jgi:hypothetical protein
MRRSWSWLGCAMLALAGCEAATDEGESLSLEVGPEGATLVGEPGTALYGVSLEIPPGALSELTRITIEPTLDETLLPDGAERVGAQFAILPAGTELAAPAILRLPVDVLQRGALESEPEDVRVWVRSGDGWSLREPVETTATTVTISLDTLDTAAAGVRLTDRTNALRCGGAGQPACATVVAACDPAAGPGFCVEALTPTIAPLSALFASGSSVYYSGLQSGEGRIVQLDAETGALRHLAGTPGPCNAALPTTSVPTGLIPRVAIDGQGNLWKNTCRFGFGSGLPAFQDFPLPAPTELPGRVYRLFASAQRGDGNMLLVGSRLSITGAEANERIYITRAPSGALISSNVNAENLETSFPATVPDPSDPTRVLVLGDRLQIGASGVTGNASAFFLAPNGAVAGRVPGVPDDLLGGADCGADGDTEFCVTLTEPVLDAQAGTILAVSPRIPNVRNAARLMRRVDRGAFTEVPVGSLAPRLARILDAELDSTGGIFFVAVVGTPAGAGHTDVQNELYHLAAGATEARLIPLQQRPISIAVTPEDTVIAMVLSSTARALVRVRSQR